MEQLAQYINQIQVPRAHDNIYNEECVYSYDTPVILKAYFFADNFKCLAFQETETGLYVSLCTFLGFGKDYVEGYFKKTGNAVFLHIQRQKTEVRLCFVWVTCDSSFSYI